MNKLAFLDFLKFYFFLSPAGETLREEIEGFFEKHSQGYWRKAAVVGWLVSPRIFDVVFSELLFIFIPTFTYRLKFC